MEEGSAAIEEIVTSLHVCSRSCSWRCPEGFIWCDRVIARTTMQEETARLESLLATKERLQQSRLLNTESKYLSDNDLSNLESSVKKNTTLNKKLRALNDSNVTDAVIRDITSTNQSRFLPEAAIALVQGTLKVSSVANVMRVCPVCSHLSCKATCCHAYRWNCPLQVVEIMHRRYQPFKEELQNALHKDLDQLVDLADSGAVCKRRALVKLCIDLDIVGIISSENPLRIVLKQIVVRFRCDITYARRCIVNMSAVLRECRKVPTSKSKTQRAPQPYQSLQHL